MSKSKKPDRTDTFLTDLEELQRKIRTLELDRKLKVDTTSSSINKIQTQVDTLKNENNKLKHELELETRQAKLFNTSSSAIYISKMQLQIDGYILKIENEKKKYNDYINQITNAKDTMYQLKKLQRGSTAADDVLQQIQKKIHSLENKLDKALVKLNEALTHNKNLRETIENLRRERGIFDGIYKKLELELLDKKNEMLLIIDEYNINYLKRDEIYMDMTNLKLRADEDQKKFEHEWRKLSNLVQQDRINKTTTNINIEDGPPNSGNVASTPMSINSEAESQLKKKLMLKLAEIEADSEAIEKTSKKVVEFEQIFNKIQNETGISSIDELVSHFIESEDQNFSLFNYVNDLNSKMENIEEEIHALTQERDKLMNADSTLSASEPRKKKMDTLDQNLLRTNAGNTAIQKHYDETSKSLTTIKGGISKLLDKFQLHDADKLPADGENSMSQANMLAYLSKLEKHTDKMLLEHLSKSFAAQNHPKPEEAAAQYFSDRVKASEAPLLDGPSVTNVPEIPLVVSDVDSEDDDENDIPMSLEELHHRAVQDMPSNTKRKNLKYVRK